MVIYGEYLFLENFITGLIITYFTVKIAGYKLIWYRIFLCGVCCGVYSFSLFADLNGVISFFGEIFFVLGASWIAFGKKSIKEILQSAALFFIVTLFFGGIAVAALNTFQWEGIASSGGIYLPRATYFTVMSAGISAAVTVQFTINLIREKRKVQRTVTEVVLRIGEKTWEVQGFIDTGNMLKDPLNGKPVAVVSRTLMAEILIEGGNAEERYRAIPYCSVGVNKGVLEGYRIDELTAEGRCIKRPVLAALKDEELLSGEGKDGQIILPGSMMEGGLYGENN